MCVIPKFHPATRPRKLSADDIQRLRANETVTATTFALKYSADHRKEVRR